MLSMPNEQASRTAQSEQVPLKAVTPSGEEIEISEVVVSQPASPHEAAANSLPKTASSLPLLGLLGLLSLAASGSSKIRVTRVSTLFCWRLFTAPDAFATNSELRRSSMRSIE